MLIMAEYTAWPSGARDTTEFPNVDIQINVSFREHLAAFCRMDGLGWNDYEEQGTAGNLAVSNSRMRTFRKMYERLGLIYKENNSIRLSRLGVQMAHLEEELNKEKEKVLNNLRETSIDILSRYQLRNPVDEPGLPASCDVLPCVCIWFAMRQLDNKINYEEMNRVILRVMCMDELEAAIDKIRNARAIYGTYENMTSEELDTVLGVQVHTDQPTARIAPWFSFAGWGGLIVEQQADSEGYRRFCGTSLIYIDRILDDIPSYYETTDKDDWLRYYIGTAAETSVQEIEGETEADQTVVHKPDETTRVKNGANTILYGVPGSGKSWTIEHEYCDEDCIVERLVFHPDYTNADFIGQILPIVDEQKQVTYEFTAGPFTTILKDAYWDPTNKYILILEEINRGNAPAIFGEIFQLLDRKVTLSKVQVENEKYPVGTSEYGITHKDIAQYVYGDRKHEVRIPSNLYIIGTMNTSDQNVFTLDTAFQRRWRMRLIENNFDNVDPKFADVEILDTQCSWRRFNETVNKIIVGNSAKMASAEDKRLGVYFIHKNEMEMDIKALPSGDYTSSLAEFNDLLGLELTEALTPVQKVRLKVMRDAFIHNRMFAEKVIKYLWDDAFKFNPGAIFDTENLESLEDVIRMFVYSKGSSRFNIFKQNVCMLLYPQA